jgi:hypothetical protein
MLGPLLAIPPAHDAAGVAAEAKEEVGWSWSRSFEQLTRGADLFCNSSMRRSRPLSVANSQGKCNTAPIAPRGSFTSTRTVWSRGRTPPASSMSIAGSEPCCGRFSTVHPRIIVVWVIFLIIAQDQLRVRPQGRSALCCPTWTPWPAALGTIPDPFCRALWLPVTTKGRIREPGGDPHARARARVRGLRSPVHWCTR